MAAQEQYSLSDAPSRRVEDGVGDRGKWVDDGRAANDDFRAAYGFLLVIAAIGQSAPRKIWRRIRLSGEFERFGD